MTILPELRGFVDKLGRQTVYIRVTNKGKRTYKATNIHISEKDWDKETLSVKKSHPNYRQHNQTIKRLLAETEVLPSPTPSVDLKTYVMDSIGEWENTKSSETIRQHWSELNKLNAMGPAKLPDINIKWLKKYQDHLYSLGNKTNTVWKSFKFLKTIMRKAHREKLITENPFDSFEGVKYRDPKKIFLSREQVEQIDKKCLDKNCPNETFIAGTWFIISCFTGLRFGDCQHFSKKQIKGDRLIVYTRKTGEVVSIPLSEKVKKLFERINYQPLPYVNVHTNRLLKDLALRSGIDENISFHCSRHTFATMALTVGIRMEVVSKMLGHSSLKHTQVYAKLIDPVVDEEMKKMG